MTPKMGDTIQLTRDAKGFADREGLIVIVCVPKDTILRVDLWCDGMGMGIAHTKDGIEVDLDDRVFNYVILEK